MNNPLRFWRTGAVAVVLAALGGAGFADDASAVEERSLQRLVSPYDVDETVQTVSSLESRYLATSLPDGHETEAAIRSFVVVVCVLALLRTAASLL